MNCFVAPMKIGNDSNFLLLGSNADATVNDEYCEPSDVYHFTIRFNRDSAAKMIRTMIHVKHEEGIGGFAAYELLTGELINEFADENTTFVFKKKNSPRCYTFCFGYIEEDLNTARKMANRLLELVHNVKPYNAQADAVDVDEDEDDAVIEEPTDESEELF